MTDDPIRTAAEQLADEMAQVSDFRYPDLIEAAFRQQRAAVEQERAERERDWDCKYGCDGRESCLLPDALGRAEAAEAEVSRLRAALETMGGVLREARLHVRSQNEAEHLLDGFGPRKPQPSDALLSAMDDLLRA